MGTALAGQKLQFRSSVPCRCTRARTVFTRAELTLKPLPYSEDALEPHISRDTLNVHWGKHHRTYVTNLNNQIKDKPMANKTLNELIVEAWNSGSPTPEFNNAGQVFNHDFYWESMCPNGGGEPTGELKAAIERDFGSFDEFKTQFKAAGATQFGSGWAWLVAEGGKLKVTKTPNAENPLTNPAQTPLLTMDVWEHAYYLDVQNRRPDYISTFVDKLINWDKVAERFAEAK
ncbi:hypothetical protein WJX81_004068 [Elliptochloris bilobata]|uniref:Superoxide dismutase n=1 Tax=Elliptochloris bilobata TaxID=381761 RepID=A0AAW1S9K2_9CHLO